MFNLNTCNTEKQLSSWISGHSWFFPKTALRWFHIWHAHFIQHIPAWWIPSFDPQDSVESPWMCWHVSPSDQIIPVQGMWRSTCFSSARWSRWLGILRRCPARLLGRKRIFGCIWHIMQLAVLVDIAPVDQWQTIYHGCMIFYEAENIASIKFIQILETHFLPNFLRMICH